MTPPVRRVRWATTHRIIRDRHPAIALFEDIADPADWDAILSALAKTDPAQAAAAGDLGLVPAARRVGGPGASRVMAPFTHVSHDRPSRFSDGSYGLYYAGDRLEVALRETIHNHEMFMRRTGEAAGWTSDFLHLLGTLDAELHDVNALPAAAGVLDPGQPCQGTGPGAGAPRRRLGRGPLRQRALRRRRLRRPLLARRRRDPRRGRRLFLRVGRRPRHPRAQPHDRRAPRGLTARPSARRSRRSIHR